MQSVMQRLSGAMATIGAVLLGLVSVALWLERRSAMKQADARRMNAVADRDMVSAVIHAETAEKAMARADAIAKKLSERVQTLKQNGHPTAAATLERLNRHARS